MADDTLESLAAKLARIDDERTIERLIYSYGHILDFGTPQAFAAIFTDDAVIEIQHAFIQVLKLDVPFPPEGAAFLAGKGAVQTDKGYAFVGHEAIVGFVTRAPSTVRSLHVSSQPLVTITGDDTASARTYLRIYRQAHGEAPQLLNFGRYHDELVRTDDGWRIARRICEL